MPNAFQLNRVWQANVGVAWTVGVQVAGAAAAGADQAGVPAGLLEVIFAAVFALDAAACVEVFVAAAPELAAVPVTRVYATGPHEVVIFLVLVAAVQAAFVPFVVNDSGLSLFIPESNQAHVEAVILLDHVLEL